MVRIIHPSLWAKAFSDDPCINKKDDLLNLAVFAIGIVDRFQVVTENAGHPLPEEGWYASSYDLIDDVKGGIPAFFWQGVARIFGNNLKSKYDPFGEDRQIEQIIYSIDMGLIWAKITCLLLLRIPWPYRSGS